MVRIIHAIRVFWIARVCTGSILCWLAATMPVSAQATAARQRRRVRVSQRSRADVRRERRRHHAPACVFCGADFADPLVSPAYAPAVLAAFPPTLVISGTRDDLLSPAVYTHTQLVKAGVEADLHVWEGRHIARSRSRWAMRTFPRTGKRGTSSPPFSIGTCGAHNDRLLQQSRQNAASRRDRPRPADGELTQDRGQPLA
jgi:hypothetical protein